MPHQKQWPLRSHCSTAQRARASFTRTPPLAARAAWPRPRRKQPRNNKMYGADTSVPYPERGASRRSLQSAGGWHSDPFARRGRAGRSIRRDDNRTIRCLRLIALVAACMVATIPANAQTASTCRASDANAVRLLGYVRQLVTSADPVRVRVRDSLGLPATSSSNVSLVTDNLVCDKVAQGVNAATGTSGLTRHLYVLKVGPYYAAQDPDHPSGEWWPTVSLDKQFHVLGVVLAP